MRVLHDLQHWAHAGTYIIGCQQAFSVDNNMVITRMEDEGGTEWSRPVKLTEAREFTLLLSSDSRPQSCQWCFCPGTHCC